MHKENGSYYLDCAVCGNEFEVGKNTYYKQNAVHLCLHCRVAKKNSDPNVRGKRNSRIYICEECGRQFAMTIERHEKRLREYGNCLCTSCSKKGEKNPFFRQMFTEQQKSLLSSIRSAYYDDPDLGPKRRAIVSEHTLGENNPMYKGAEFCTDFTWRDKHWRGKALERDHYQCCVCHKYFSADELIVHHLDSCNWSKTGRKNLGNMVTVCNEDHKLFHHIYGYGNNTKEQFEEFLLKRFRDYPERE